MSLYDQNGYGYGPYGIEPQAPLVSQPIGYYLNLLTSQYRLAPALNKWLPKLLKYGDDTTNAISQITESYDLDYAVGSQLDTLGLIAGVSRQVPFQPSGGVSPILTDAVYRTLIQATLANNQWDGKIGSLQAIWQALFPGGSIKIIDNQNMSATIVVSGGFSSIIQDLIANDLIVPRPETVEYNYVFSNLPIFGYDENDGFIGGYDRGLWS
jgi:hypothetical protein